MGKIEIFAPVPPAAVSRVLATFDRDQLAGFIAIAIDLLDLADGDPDLESGTDLEDDFTLSDQAVGLASQCPDADIEQDAGAWIEWETLRKNLKAGPNLMAGHEDDEEDDPAGQSTEDEVSYGDPNFGSRGPGCPISDPDKAVDDDACDEPRQDLEREQMADDVPMLPVHSLEYNIFNDKRVPLGISNLQSSYRACVGEIRSADTGRMLVTDRTEPDKPGTPV